MIPNRRSFLFRGMTSLAVLSGCAEPPAAPLRVGINAWVGYDPLVLARERGWTDATRLRVVDMFSNSESLRALRNGLLDAAALTLDEVLRETDAGLPLTILSVLSVSAGADAVLARPEVRQAVDLRGRRIGFERSALGALMLDQLLQEGSLRPEEVQVLAVEGAQHVDMLRTGRVDAVVTFEPMVSQLRNLGFRTIFDSRQMPGEIIDVLACRRGVRPEQAMPLLQAWARGLAALQSNPAAAASLLAASAELSEQDYLQTLKGLRFMSLDESATELARDEHGHVALATQAAAMLRTLRRLSLVRQDPDWPRLVDDRALQRLLRPAGAA